VWNQSFWMVVCFVVAACWLSFCFCFCGAAQFVVQAELRSRKVLEREGERNWSQKWGRQKRRGGRKEAPNSVEESGPLGCCSLSVVRTAVSSDCSLQRQSGRSLAPPNSALKAAKQAPPLAPLTVWGQPKGDNALLMAPELRIVGRPAMLARPHSIQAEQLD